MIHDLRALVDSTHGSSLLHREADSVASMLYLHPSSGTAFPHCVTRCYPYHHVEVMSLRGAFTRSDCPIRQSQHPANPTMHPALLSRCSLSVVLSSVLSGH